MSDRIHEVKVPEKGWIKAGPFTPEEIQKIDDTLGWWWHFENGPECTGHVVEGEEGFLYFDYDDPDYLFKQIKKWCRWDREILYEVWHPSKVKDHVKDRTVYFEYFRDGELWYRVSGTNLVFPVPTDPKEVGSATFKSSDKALIFMRYIRKYLAALEKERDGGENE